MKRLVILWPVILLTSLLTAQTSWYPSDSLGRLLPGGRAASVPGKGWFVGVERLDKQEKRTLMQDSQERSVVVADLDDANRQVRTRVFQDGMQTQEVTYLAGSPLPVSETVFTNGRPSTVFRYAFGATGLLRRRAESADGRFLYEDRLSRFPDGRLRRLERDGPSGALAEVSWTYDAKGIAQVWLADEDLKAAGRHKVLTYSTGSVREDLLDEVSLLLTKTTLDVAGGGTGERETLPKDGTVVEHQRDSRGRQVREVSTTPGQNPLVTRWTWDDSDRLVRSETDIPGGLETTDYRYGPDSTVAETRRLGVLSTRLTSRDGEKVLVELFDRGKKFLEEVWDGGRKTIERYFRDDLVVRERTL